MIALSAESAAGYLAGTPYAHCTQAVPLSGGVANVVLMCRDPASGAAIVLKQPLPKFKTAEAWLVDIDRAKVEHEAAELCGTILPAGSVPGVLFFDEANYILALEAAPAGAVIWKAALLSGEASADAAVHAGTLLALLHSHTMDDAGLKARYGDPAFFVQQRTDPYLIHAAGKHPALAGRLREIAGQLLATHRCLIHGDFSPKNIFLVPHAGREAGLSHLMVLDFEVAFYGHPGFDVATLINHLVLKGALQANRGAAAEPFLEMARGFWETYRHTADGDLVRLASAHGGHILGALLLARVDGKSPVEYLVPLPGVQAAVRAVAADILSSRSAGLEEALGRAAGIAGKISR